MACRAITVLPTMGGSQLRVQLLWHINILAIDRIAIINCLNLCAIYWNFKRSKIDIVFK